MTKHVEEDIGEQEEEEKEIFRIKIEKKDLDNKNVGAFNYLLWMASNQNPSLNNPFITCFTVLGLCK